MKHFKCCVCGKPPKEEFISTINGEETNSYFCDDKKFCSPYCANEIFKKQYININIKNETYGKR